MKNLLKPIFFLLISFLLIGCQKDQMIDQEPTTIDVVKSWYANNHNPRFDENPYFSGQPDWSNYFQIEGQIYIPLVSLSYNTSRNQLKISDLENKVYAKPYLVLQEKSQNEFKESLQVFLTSNESNFESNTTMLGLSYLKYGYDNKTEGKSLGFFQSKKEKIDPSIAKLPHLNAPIVKTDCDTFYVVQTTTSSEGYVQNVEIIATFEVCGLGNYSSGGGGNSGNGNSGTGNNSNAPEFEEESQPWPYPHCSSWEYAMRNGVRGASVTGMSELFVQMDIDAGGIYTNNVWVSFPTLYFTAPIGMTNGQAATATATAMAVAQDETNKWFAKNPRSTDDAVTWHYYDEMRKQMQKMYGSVSTINTYNMINPTPYREDLYSTGDCR